MNRESKDLTIDKIRLIYEYNPGSPLFARVASSIIEQGNILEALEILDKGIVLYPGYPTSYFILALVYAYMGKEKEAKDSVVKGFDLLGYRDTLDFYQKKIDEIISERNSLIEAKRPAFIGSKDEVDQELIVDIEDRLDMLALQLSNAKIKYTPDTQPIVEPYISRYTGKKIASETLAGIYLSQKNYKEAIIVYEEMIRKNPDKAAQFIAKISEIKAAEEGETRTRSQI